MRNRCLIPILMLILLPLLSCRTKDGREESLRMIAEWSGKEILFPDSMMLVDGNIADIGNTDFTIVSYYDSVGCTGCRMKLAYWNEFMRKVDSFPVKVDLILIATSRDRDKLRSLVKSYAFRHSLIWDPEGLFESINHLPDELQFQTYLLDHDNRILAIGNPLGGRKMEKLYLSTLSEGMSDMTDNEGETVFSHDFGRVAPDEIVSHIFMLRNETSDTLKVRDLITSCECTSAHVFARCIPPYQNYEVKTTFIDTIAGEFYRTVTLLFEDGREGVTMELTGEIVDRK